MRKSLHRFVQQLYLRQQQVEEQSPLQLHLPVPDVIQFTAVQHQIGIQQLLAQNQVTVHHHQLPVPLDGPLHLLQAALQMLSYILPTWTTWEIFAKFLLNTKTNIWRSDRRRDISQYSFGFLTWTKRPWTPC